MPGYFDLQVNGYAGVDFNQDDLGAEALHECCARLQADGVAGVLATIITDHGPLMVSRVRRLHDLRAADPLVQEIIAGIHVEGPFISPIDGYRGAHPRDAVRSADLDLAREMIDAANGLLRLFTLAPEQDPGQRLIKLLAQVQVVVAGGHSDASLDQLKAAADAGLSLWTHLGNGCPMLMHRHDNIIQRVLALGDRIRPTFIADGVHVPLWVLGNYLRLAGLDRAMVVTDAMAAAGLGPGTYQLGRWHVAVDENLAAWAPDRSHLVGSAGTMRRSAENLRQLGITAEQITALCSANAHRLLNGQ